MDTGIKAACKIEEWLQENIIVWCNVQEIPKLLIELELLQHTLSEQFRLVMESEYHALSEWIKTKKIDSTLTGSEKLHIYENGIDQKDFLKNLKTRHKYLKNLYLITFLVSRSDSAKINSIRSLYFFLCLKMVQLTDYESRIETTLDECRFLTNKTREFLIPFLPDLTEMDSLEDVQDNLIQAQNNDNYTRWLNNSPDTFESEIKRYGSKLLDKNTLFPSSDARNDINERISQYLYEYILPIENFFKNVSGITRITSTTYQVVNGPSYYDDTTGNTFSDLVNIFESTSNTDAFEASERQDNEQESFEQVTIDNPSNYYLDLVKAGGQSNSRRKNAMNQVTDVNTAHEDEIKRLVEYIASKLSRLDFLSIGKEYEYEHEYEEGKFKFDISDQSALYLYMLLLTGIHDIYTSEQLKLGSNGYRYQLTFCPARSHVDDDWDKSLCAYKSNKLNKPDRLYVFMPYPLGAMHIEMIESTDDKVRDSIHEEAKEDLRKLNKEFGIRLSINKVKNYLPHYLAQTNIDKALIEVLTNCPVHHLSALPYYNVSQYDLFRCQRDYMDHLIGLLENKYEPNQTKLYMLFELPDETLTDYWDKTIGSALAVNEFRLEEIVFKLRQKVEAATVYLKLNNLDSLVCLHNSFMDYLYVLMSVASGYRPVTEPFGRLSDIDTRTGVYFISDKEMQDDTIGRLIYLPHTVCQQINEYEKFIKSNGILFNKLGSNIGQIYMGILDSHIGLISYLKLDEITNTVIQLKLNKVFIKERMSQYISLPLNWHRHFIRSLKNIHIGKYSYNSDFNERPIGYDVISAWMGHSDELGFSFYDPFSGLKRSELREFANTLDELIKGIGFTVIQLER
ncbi:hypothetical protein ES754_00790 [Psychrobacter frigidicola]|uniref:Uncharacterized protein n=1 Tax=Psychrobacter frigidicola TaxID=45611 RepID=A0A5C7A6X8_9GAMM|nr:hypothetical protein [Psychrobacter frigidicola]TXD97556.1 hypothetical protein ES754_00790 [Psychrobacter frigidicola]